MQLSKDKTKPENERLNKRVQCMLKSSEFKNMQKLRSLSAFATDAAYVRALILADQNGKKQMELF